MTVDWFSLIQV